MCSKKIHLLKNFYLPKVFFFHFAFYEVAVLASVNGTSQNKIILVTHGPPWHSLSLLSEVVSSQQWLLAGLVAIVLLCAAWRVQWQVRGEAAARLYRK